MVKNNRGQFMALYLVMLTLLMCGIVFMSGINHKKDLSVSLVSPLPVLEVRDNLSVFEMREVELIRTSLKISGLDADKFRSEFISGISEEMKSFISSDLIYNSNELGVDFDKDGVFFDKVLYSVEEDSGNLILKRSNVGKKMVLKIEGDSKVSFPVGFVYEFPAEYLISKEGNKFLVERV